MDKKEVPYLTVMHASTRTLREIAEELRQIANSFRATGNNEMSSQLLTLSYDLAIVQKDITNAVTAELKKNMTDANEISKTIVQAVLAGLTSRT